MDYSQVLYLRIGQLIDFMERSFVLLLEIVMNIGKRLTNKVAIVTGGARSTSYDSNFISQSLPNIHDNLQ